MPNPGPMPLTPEWHRYRVADFGRTERPVVFGATEAAAVLNKSPYETALDVYLRKRGEHTEAVEDNVAMKVGRALEPVVLDLYGDQIGAGVISGLPMYFSGDHPFMACTPDGMVGTVGAIEGALGSGEEPDWNHVVDAKTSTFQRYSEFGLDDTKFGSEGTDQLPVDLLFQAQQQMAVMEVDKAAYPVLFDARTLRVYHVERSDALIGAIVAAEKELAERIVNGDPPEPNWSHPETAKALQALNPRMTGETIDLSERAVSAWVKSAEINDHIKLLQDEYELCRNIVRAEMGTAEFGRFPSGSMELHRVVVKDSLWLPKHIEEATEKQGQVWRKGHERLTQRKVRR